MSDFQLGPGPLMPEFEQVKSDIGIVENGDTATHAIPKGYYVIWKGDLYVAKSDISSGTTLSSSNLTAKTSGIGADLAALNSNKSNKIQTTPKSITTNTNGVADLGMTEAQTIIVAITCQDWIAIPFIVGSGRNWWVKILGWSNMSPAVSQTLSVNVMHIS